MAKAKKKEKEKKGKKKKKKKQRNRAQGSYIGRGLCVGWVESAGGGLGFVPQLNLLVSNFCAISAIQQNGRRQNYPLKFNLRKERRQL